MSEMPSREEFEQFKELRNKGDYRAAAKILLPYKENPKVRKLIGELREAHESGKKLVSKPVSKSKPKANWSKRLLLFIAGLMGICGVIYGTYLAWYYVTDQESIGDAFGMELDLWGLCFDLYYEDHFVEEFADAFSEGCFKEARSMLIVWPDEIEYCWRQTNEGKLERQFINCLVDNDVSMIDVYIISEIANARKAAEEITQEVTEEAASP